MRAVEALREVIRTEAMRVEKDSKSMTTGLGGGDDDEEDKGLRLVVQGAHTDVGRVWGEK